MLNPRAFFEDCIRNGKLDLWDAGFPFELVDQCVDNQTLKYSAEDEEDRTVRYFEEKTSLSWENILDPEEMDVECPKCTGRVLVPWTRGIVNASVVDSMFQDFYGFADKGFHAKCPNCMSAIDHDKLTVAKFRKDVLALMTTDRPMPGTYYNLNGVPEAPYTSSKNRTQFPNRFMRAMGPYVADFTDPTSGDCQSMAELRATLSRHIHDRDEGKATYSSDPKMYAEEQGVFRRMMSRYWENASPFALDLVGAVIRQGTFVQKMDNIDWLHSPALRETMNRLVKKYAIFFRIMAKNPRRMAVPTLDVDLAWHTHQLFPRRYYTYSTHNTEDHCLTPIFVNHDDKVEELKLDEGFEWTTRQYTRETHGRIYSECTCWYCEAIRAPELYMGPSIFRSSAVMKARENAATLRDRPDMSDPEKNPHISAHNAVPTIASTIHKRDTRIAQLQSNFEKVCRRASKRKGKSEQEKAKGTAARDNGMTSYHGEPLIYSHPSPIPCYAPFMCDPGINDDSYAGSPVCSSVGGSSSSGAGLAACGSGGCSGGGCGGSSCSM